MFENYDGHTIPDPHKAESTISSLFDETSSQYSDSSNLTSDNDQRSYYSMDDDIDEEDTEDENYLENDEDNEDDEDNNNDNGNKKSSPLKLLFSMMLNPIEGWKNIRRRDLSVERTSGQCFIPLAALAACACFMECIYNSATTLSMAMIEGVKVFVALFFGNFLALALEKMMLPKDYKDISDSVFGKKYMMYLMSTMAIFMILYELLPMIGPIIAFTPLWTIYLAMRGAKFFRFPAEKRNLLTALVCMIVVASPFAVYWIFDILLPSGIE